MMPEWIESKAYELAEEIENQMEKAYNVGYDEGKGQTWSEEVKKYELEPEKLKEAELRGAQKAWEFACHLYNVSPDVTNAIYLSMNGGKGLGVALEMPYIKAVEMYENWKQLKELSERMIRGKVKELADEIGIHKLYSIVKDIRGE